MPHPTQRPGGRSARITAAVRAATMAALLEHGFAGMQMEDIAARAGVNKSTLYRRWGSRERLLADALAASSGQQVPIPDTGSLRGDLQALALRVRDAVVAPSTRVLMTALAAGREGDDLAGVGRDFWEHRLAAARPIVERAVARGELPRDSEPDELIVRVVGPIWFAVFGPGHPVDDAFVVRTIDIVIRGLTTFGGGDITDSDTAARAAG
jgi:AcrR family transcriptional regulator